MKLIPGFYSHKSVNSVESPMDESLLSPLSCTESYDYSSPRCHSSTSILSALGLGLLSMSRLGDWDRLAAGCLLVLAKGGMLLLVQMRCFHLRGEIWESFEGVFQDWKPSGMFVRLGEVLSCDWRLLLDDFVGNLSWFRFHFVGAQQWVCKVAGYYQLDLSFRRVSWVRLVFRPDEQIRLVDSPQVGKIPQVDAIQVLRPSQVFLSVSNFKLVFEAHKV